MSAHSTMELAWNRNVENVWERDKTIEILHKEWYGTYGYECFDGSNVDVCFLMF